MARPQRGFTLVEVILAVVVLSVGVLGLASSAALATRMIVRGQLEADAALLATRRLEALRAGSCRAAHSGHDTVPPFRVSWTAGSPARGAVAVTVAVAWASARGERVHRFHTVIPCAP